MPTNVLPAWIKSLLLITFLTAGWWSFTGKSRTPEHETSAYLMNGLPEVASSFSAKTGANIRQFVTNPLEPAPVSDEGKTILRTSGADYYRDQPRD